MRAVCDANVIRRVIANLVANAMKFTPEKGQIVVRVAPDAMGQKVSVVDTGSGIAPEYHEKIFYHIAQKAIVPGVHPTVSLVITYATSLMACAR